VSPEHAYAPYVRRLIREIELSGFDQPPETIFFGGGTPSILDGAAIQEILASLPAGSTEISLEANPGTLTETKLEQYRRAGVNRISLGVQSFNDEDLKNAGRLHTSAHVHTDIASLRKAGFNNINIDLIAGLPRQRIEIWKRNLDLLRDIRPEHVSIYMLDVEERSLWGKSSSEIPEEDIFADFYVQAEQRLHEAGYVHYEISNWALPGFECRHNLKYWTGAPYRGFGVSAHSFSRNPREKRFWNTASLTEYTNMLDAGRLPISAEEELTRDMRLEEAFLIGLRRICGFDIWHIAGELGFHYPQSWFDRLCELEDAGWIEFDGKFLKLTPSGRLLANGVTEELLWPDLLSTSEAIR
jgi:oxygen-independent coproporphyrinogen-3 oxidase